MSTYVLQINYRRDPALVPEERDFREVAEAIAATPGLLWKVWLINESTNEGGGIYLFDDPSALDAFVCGPIVTSLETHPAFRNLSVKSFRVMEEMTRVTRGPIPEEDDGYSFVPGLFGSPYSVVHEAESARSR